MRELFNKNLFKNELKNKYNLKPYDIEKALVINKRKLHKSPFWRNNVTESWNLSKAVGSNDFIISFYDNDKIKLTCSCWDGMGNYKFDTFFKAKDIDNISDFHFQKELLQQLEWLIDEKIVKIGE